MAALISAVVGVGCVDSSGSFRPRTSYPRSRSQGNLQDFSPEAFEDRGLSLAWTYQQSGKRADEIRIEQMHLAGADSESPDTLYLQTANAWLYSIELSSGMPLWTTRRLPGPLTVPPAQTERNLFLVDHDVLYVYDVERKPARIEKGKVEHRFAPSGELRYRLPMDFTPSTSAVSNDQFVAFGTDTGDLYSIPIHRIDLAIQKQAPLPLYASMIQWKHPVGSSALGPIWCPSFGEQSAVSRNNLVASFENGRVLKCMLDRFVHDGAGVWEFGRTGRLEAGPCVRGGHVFLGSVDCNFYVLDALDGAYLGALPMGGPIRATPVVLGGRIDPERPDPKTLKIYVQQDKPGSTGAQDAQKENAGFCSIRVDDPNHLRGVITFLDEKNQPIENADLKMRRWLMSVAWRLPGDYRFVSEGPRTLYLHDVATHELVAVDPGRGQEKWRLGLHGIDFVLSDRNDPTDPARIGSAGRVILGASSGKVYCFQER